MVYHLVYWEYKSVDPNSFLGKAQFYGVSIFYVLSGLTMYHVYFKKMEGWKEVKTFFIKRVFRIYPLLWLVTGATILLGMARPSLFTIFLNFTGLFGIIRPYDYIGTGIWSIGNELAFYLLFPFLVFTAKGSKLLFYSLLLATLGVYIYCAYTLHGDYWKDYVNPLNQAFLFAAGFFIGWSKMKARGGSAILFILIGLALFILTPASSDLDLITDETRLIFTALCIVICIGFYKLRFEFPKFLHWPLSKIGEASYSIYLIHPLVAFGLGLVFNKFPADPLVKVITGVIATLVISYAVYVTIEKYFIRKGKEITK